MSDGPHLSPELAARLAPLAAAFDLLADHVVVTDADGHILYANPAVERATGYSIAEIIGKNPGELWGGKMPAEFYDQLWHRIKKDKQPFVGEVKNRRKDGVEEWQSLHISPVLNDKGDVELFIGMEPAISDRKDREAFREEMLSVVGHQTLSPATAISWMIEWLFGHGHLTDEQRSELKKIYDENRRVIDIVRDLIFLSREGRGHPGLQHIDVSTILKKEVESARSAHSHVEISYEEPGEPCKVLSYPTLVQQLVRVVVSHPAAMMDAEGGRMVILLKAEGKVATMISRVAGGTPKRNLPHQLIATILTYLGWPSPSYEYLEGRETITLMLPLAA